MPKGQKKSERLQVQLGAYVSRRRYPKAADRERARKRAIRQFLRTGEAHVPGVRLVARWRNPDRRSGIHWRVTTDPDQSLYEFWSTLHGSRGALRGLAERYL
jgi:ligand-binding sensor domain-containing protein